MLFEMWIARASRVWKVDSEIDCGRRVSEGCLYDEVLVKKGTIVLNS